MPFRLSYIFLAKCGNHSTLTAPVEQKGNKLEQPKI